MVPPARREDVYVAEAVWQAEVKDGTADMGDAHGLDAFAAGHDLLAPPVERDSDW